MFNPLTPSQMVAAAGRVASGAARSQGEFDEYQRGQLLSAYSTSRHLVPELTLIPRFFETFRADLARELRKATGGECLPALDGIEAKISECADGVALGQLLGEALAGLRAESSDGAEGAIRLIHRRLRDLAEEEVRLFDDQHD